MHIPRLLFAVCLPLYCLTARAQNLSASMDSSTRSREKIHLHTDKNLYLAGETIWFKAYVLSDGLPAITATNLYVNLLDGRGAILQQKRFPLADASGDGSFTLPDSLPSANLLLAAYTSEIKPGDSDLVYYKNIAVITTTAPANEPVGSASLQFLPEGGTFIQGIPNHLAFKADLSNGFPFPVKAVIKNSTGTVVDSITALHNGMGEFLFTPDAGEKYYAEWKDEKNVLRQTYLPASANGVNLHAEQLNGFLYYVIQNPAPDENLREINIGVVQDDEKIYMATLDMGSAPVLSGKIPLAKLHAGIVRLTASGRNKEPLAERISFIQNDFRFEAGITVTGKGAGKREKNTVEIEIPDTLASNLSLAIYDAQFNSSNGPDIYSDLLLSGDIRGYVHEPGWYFTDASAERKKALDLVMLTHGWRKYSRQEKGSPDYYITLSGTVTDMKKNPQNNLPITLMVAGRDSTKQFYNVVTDRFGRFAKRGLFFYDSVSVLYQINRNPGDPEMQLMMDKTGIPPFTPAFIPSTPFPQARATSIITGLPEVFVPQKMADGFTDKGYRLDDITVKSRKWRSNPMLQMDEKYATGIFRANATAFSFDVMNDPMANKKGDIMNYLLGKVPGLTVRNAQGGLKILQYSHGHTPVPIELFFIDEQPFRFDPADGAAYSQIQALNMDNVAYVKFFDRYPLEPDKPALAIYLKKGNEPDASKTSVLPKLKTAGYSTVKEFYSPDYSVAENRKTVSDKRTTLLWQPYILTSKNNRKATITFYNNDISTHLYLVLEGMNEIGKLVRVEKKL